MHTSPLYSFPAISAFSLGLLLSPFALASNPHVSGNSHNGQHKAVQASRNAPHSGKRASRNTGHHARTLVLYKVHTLQHFSTVFWINGHFDPAGMHKLNYFLRDEHNNRVRRMDPHLIMLLWRIQRASGGRPIGIVSAYRSPRTNHALRKETDEVAKHSMHPLGRAADIRISGMTEPQVYRLARRMHAGGVGYYTRNKFVHVDTGPIRFWSGH